MFADSTYQLKQGVEVSRLVFERITALILTVHTFGGRGSPSSIFR